MLREPERPTLHEYVGCLHLHTTASDGALTHEEVIQAAQGSGLDFLIVTDHNALVKGKEGWFFGTLMLVDQEIHDVEREPEASHLLCFDLEEDMTPYAKDPQGLVDAVNEKGGFCFLAHPYEKAPPFTKEPDLSWMDWDVKGYTGLEIWNYMSEFKSHATSLPRALLYAFVPGLAIAGPFKSTLKKWDELLGERQKVSILGGPDAHGTEFRFGPLTRTIFPYAHCFQAERMHILTEFPFTEHVAHDSAIVYDALRAGRSFVAYDLLADSTGFRFEAESELEFATLGGEVRLADGIELRVISPVPAELRILRWGQTVARTEGTFLRYRTPSPGAYRVEAYQQHLFKRRGWVFTNPIYVTM